MTRLDHPPTRTEALDRLRAFLPHAGRDYAARRNYDLPGHPHVSVLSPYLRHRLLTETEVLEATLGRFSLSTAEKFVQEVFWRTYWKGWLELRPGVWADYRTGVGAALNRIHTEAGLRGDWEAACRGHTGIDAFDHWARELTSTGYMHNHARMWFASIWIFTLRLPWELGADFFLRNLLDGDPASNTLSWRWVAGLQTRGKHYLARPDNIARYTEGRFRPRGLDLTAGPLDGPPAPARGPLPEGGTPDPEKRIGFLLTDEDLSPGPFLDGIAPVATACLSGVAARSPLEVAPHVQHFTHGAITDVATRFTSRLGEISPGVHGPDAARDLLDWARAHRLEQIVTPYAPVGPTAETLAACETVLASAGITLVRRIRHYDAMCWPHATAGFFRFKEKIPDFTASLSGTPA